MDSANGDSGSPLIPPAQPLRDAAATCWGGVSGSWEGGAAGNLGTVMGQVLSPLTECLPLLLLSQHHLDFNSTHLTLSYPGFAALAWLPVGSLGTLDHGLQAPPCPPLQPPLPSFCTAFSLPLIRALSSRSRLWCSTPTPLGGSSHPSQPRLRRARPPPSKCQMI